MGRFIFYEPPFITTYQLGWLWDKMVHDLFSGRYELTGDVVEWYEEWVTRATGAVKCTATHWWFEDREGETRWVGPCTVCGADV